MEKVPAWPVIFLSFLAVTVLLAFTNYQDEEGEAYLGEWIITDEIYKNSELATLMTQGTVLRITPYGDHFVVEVDAGEKIGMAMRGFLPAVLREGVLYVSDPEDGGMHPMILNDSRDRLFYFAEFKRMR